MSVKRSNGAKIYAEYKTVWCTAFFFFVATGHFDTICIKIYGVATSYKRSVRVLECFTHQWIAHDDTNYICNLNLLIEVQISMEKNIFVDQNFYFQSIFLLFSVLFIPHVYR